MIYLIHFDEPFHHAQHYIGFCEDGNLFKRFDRHQAGSGSRLLRAVAKAGINFEVVRTWPAGTRDEERKLKNRKNARQLCPVCRAKKEKCSVERGSKKGKTSSERASKRAKESREIAIEMDVS